jgi:hypothetical protein
MLGRPMSKGIDTRPIQAPRCVRNVSGELPTKKKGLTASRRKSFRSNWPRRDLNPHGGYPPRDFKSRASAIPPLGLRIDAGRATRPILWYRRAPLRPTGRRPWARHAADNATHSPDNGPAA